MKIQDHPSQANRMFLVNNPNSEKEKKVNSVGAAQRKKKQQSGAESKAEAAGTILTSATSAGRLLDYLNQVKKMFLMKEMADTEGTTTKADFFEELERLNWERETLAGNTNQAEKMIFMKENDDTEGTMTKADFFGELERFDLERETLVGNIN